ncbi:MAG: DUF1292 domain-containing protein [Halanaerobiaceae bacterium]
MEEENEGTFWIDEETEELVISESGEEEHRFYVENELDVDEYRYLVLVPSEEGKGEENEALILKVVEEGDEEVLTVIEDDEEFEKVKEAYFQM